MTDCNVVVPELIQDECNGCVEKDKCINVTADLSEIGFTTEQRLNVVIEELIRRIVYLESNISN